MNIFTPNQIMSPTSPGLIFISQNQGQCPPAGSLSYRILDESFNVVVGVTDVDLVDDLVALDPNAPTAGIYAVRWTVPSSAMGRYYVEWTYVLTNPSSSVMTSIFTESPPAGTFTQPFEVAKIAPTQQPMYSFLEDARDALGCTKEDVSDRRLQSLIIGASQSIERITGRVFGPSFSNRRFGGNSARKLQVGDPIITVTSIGIDTQPTMQGDLVIELDLVRVYNRHLSQNMRNPDDRENPMIEFVHSDDLYGIRFIPFRGISLRSLAWPIGVQNIHVRGFWGYTDPDGSPYGVTPEAIQHVTRLIVAREIPKLGSDAREDAQWRWRVTEQKSRDVSVTMVAPRKWGEMYGDPEIDSILTSYTRPPSLGSA